MKVLKTVFGNMQAWNVKTVLVNLMTRGWSLCYMMIKLGTSFAVVPKPGCQRKHTLASKSLSHCSSGQETAVALWLVASDPAPWGVKTCFRRQVPYLRHGPSNRNQREHVRIADMYF